MIACVSVELMSLSNVHFIVNKKIMQCCNCNILIVELFSN